jgi:hypothetical protein
MVSVATVGLRLVSMSAPKWLCYLMLSPHSSTHSTRRLTKSRARCSNSGDRPRQRMSNGSSLLPPAVAHVPCHLHVMSSSPLSLTHSVTHTHIHTHTHSHTHSLSHTHTQTARTRARALARSLAPSLPLSLAHTHTLLEGPLRWRRRQDQAHRV